MWGQKPFNSLHWVRKSLRDGFWTIHGFYFPFLFIQHLALISLGHIVHCQILLLCTLKPCYPPLSFSDVVPHQMQILVGSLKPFHQKVVVLSWFQSRDLSLALWPCLASTTCTPGRGLWGRSWLPSSQGLSHSRTMSPQLLFCSLLNHESDIKMFFPALVWK